MNLRADFRLKRRDRGRFFIFCLVDETKKFYPLMFGLLYIGSCKRNLFTQRPFLNELVSPLLTCRCSDIYIYIYIFICICIFCDERVKRARMASCRCRRWHVVVVCVRSLIPSNLLVYVAKLCQTKT